MLKITSKRHRVEVVNYQREFESKELLGSGYSFDCDKEGKLKTEYKEALENYLYCIAHPGKYLDRGIIQRKSYYTEPAHAICKCGKVIKLDDDYMGACQCPYCDRCYNIFGQELNEYWEDNY
ncbi:hypothetical protein [Clostridium sp.]|uniref:hypothetical protein n=1 Tax=Clostridium sp. TaxID=1506 RepID=UPI003216ED81